MMTGMKLRTGKVSGMIPCYEFYGAVPAAMTHDELEFELPVPVPKERAMEAAIEQYGLCSDMDQNESGSIGFLADVLWQSTVWYFWWD